MHMGQIMVNSGKLSSALEVLQWQRVRICEIRISAVANELLDVIFEEKLFVYVYMKYLSADMIDLRKFVKVV